jgi:hypothetical protein
VNDRCFLPTDCAFLMVCLVLRHSYSLCVTVCAVTALCTHRIPCHKTFIAHYEHALADPHAFLEPLAAFLELSAPAKTVWHWCVCSTAVFLFRLREGQCTGNCS